MHKTFQTQRKTQLSTVTFGMLFKCAKGALKHPTTRDFCTESVSNKCANLTKSLILGILEIENLPSV